MIPIALITVAAVLLLAMAAGAMKRRSGTGRGRPPSAAEGSGLSDSAAAAMEDVAGPLFGVNAHPTDPEALKRRIP
jgi:hypothetical protein